jgi:hypothetical protein
MKNAIRKVVRLFVILTSLVWGLVFIVFLTKEPIERITVQIIDPYLCKKTNEGFIKVDKFRFQKDNILICGKFVVSKPNSQQQIQIFIVDNNFISYKDYYYYDQLWVNSNVDFIEVNSYLLPGKFKVNILDGKQLLSEIPIEIIN